MCTYNYSEELLFDSRDETGYAHWLVKFDELNARGERLELLVMAGSTYPQFFPGDDRVRLGIQSYAYRKNGECFGILDPQTRRSADGKRLEVVPEKLYVSTDDNRERLIKETAEMFYAR